MPRFIFPLLLLQVALVAESKIEIVKMSPSPYNENAIIKKVYSESDTVGGNSPLVLQVGEFPLGVSLPSAPQTLKGMREMGGGSTILLWVYGANGYQKRINVTNDDGTSFIENRAYFKDRYRKYIDLDDLGAQKIVITAILVNGYGESLKTPRATKSIITNYKKNVSGGVAPLEKGLEAPHLMYIEPYGNFKKDQPILLDFYIGAKNIDIGRDAYTVDVYIDGVKQDTLTEWAPYKIRGLAPGVHEFKLVLIDQKGNPVPEPFGPQTNKILVGD